MKTQLIINGEINPYYYITSDGEVYNSEGHKMTKFMTHDGYNRVKLSKGCKRGMYRVCRLVAMTFLDNPNNYPMVNHKNEIRDDDRVENLEWCNNSLNQLQRFKTKVGTKCRPVKMIDLETGEVIKEFISAIYAEKETGIARQNIYHVCRGHRNTAGGYKWEYSVPSVETIEKQ